MSHDSRRLPLGIALMFCVLIPLTAHAGKPLTSEKVKQYITNRGIGKEVKITRKDGVLVIGVITAIKGDTFEVTPRKYPTPTSVSYADVVKEGGQGMSVAGKIGTGILIGVVAFSTIIIVTLVVALH